MENRPYRSLVKSLLNVVPGTWLNRAFAVCWYRSHIEKQSDQHGNAYIRVWRYLNTTITCIYAILSVQIIWGLLHKVKITGQNTDNRRLTSLVMKMVNRSPVISRVKWKNIVSLKLTLADEVALSVRIQDVLWTKLLSPKTNINMDGPVILHESNQNAIAIN